ncbi:MAG: hypothetical protein EBR82_54905 [Caulobacteraceae bacterium]|nr:hypothetical protein [Caulobacteraceae bacterium]
MGRAHFEGLGSSAFFQGVAAQMEHKSDLLIDETVQEILYRFDVDHTFPVTYVKGGGDDNKGSWLFRVWAWIASRLGFRRHAAPALQNQQGESGASCIAVGAGLGADAGSGSPAARHQLLAAAREAGGDSDA